MRIEKISDLHLGSFNKNFEPLKEAVEMVNSLNPDYIVFTGDLVNEDRWNEAEPWIELMNGLKAKCWKYSVLGNHDYGWGRVTEKDRDRNGAAGCRNEPKNGFSGDA